MSKEQSDVDGRHDDLNRGEGNKAADRRYRRAVRKTVEDTTEEERAERARSLDEADREEARRAEEIGRSRAR